MARIGKRVKTVEAEPMPTELPIREPSPREPVKVPG